MNELMIGLAFFFGWVSSAIYHVRKQNEALREDIKLIQQCRDILAGRLIK